MNLLEIFFFFVDRSEEVAVGPVVLPGVRDHAPFVGPGEPLRAGDRAVGTRVPLLPLGRSRQHHSLVVSSIFFVDGDPIDDSSPET